jgi:hypothetical protein
MDARHEKTQLLARAFDRAWDRYYRPGRLTVAPEVARPVLAAHLVEMAKDGTVEEGVLAAAGLLHLISMTPDDGSGRSLDDYAPPACRREGPDNEAGTGAHRNDEESRAIRVASDVRPILKADRIERHASKA